MSSPFDCQSEMQLILRNIVAASIGGWRFLYVTERTPPDCSNVPLGAEINWSMLGEFFLEVHTIPTTRTDFRNRSQFRNNLSGVSVCLEWLYQTLSTRHCLDLSEFGLMWATVMDNITRKCTFRRKLVEIACLLDTVQHILDPNVNCKLYTL